ncbi:MAG TPA: DUF502 domain-containing protein [Bacteroidota bacterium]|nr:DUF502 domain-containing protein [Bacteroidota bacterium]
MNDDQKRTIWGHLRSTFGRGLAVIVPVVITIWVLRGLFEAVDGIISPVFDRTLGQHIPGLGFISMVVLIFLVGFFSRNLIGRALGAAFERVIFSIPLARTIYSTMKDLMQIGGKGKSFRQVVLIEYPRQGVWTVGFVTNEIVIGTTPPNDTISVYIPNPPNPTSGMLVLVPRSSAKILDLSVEDGLKLVLSGGIVTTGTITMK